MTKENKERVIQWIALVVIGVLTSVIFWSFTNNQDEKKSTIIKIQELDKNKAELTYVDEKVKELRAERNAQIQDIKTTMSEIKDQQSIQTEDTKKILTLIIEQKNKNGL